MADSRAGCVLLRELPPRPTQRSCKITTEIEQNSSVLDLAAFQGAEDEQHQRLQAFQETWSIINDIIKELRQHHLAPVFSQLQRWVADSAPALHKNPSGQTLELHSSSSHAAGFSRTAVAQSEAAAAGGYLRQLPLVTLSVAASTNTSATYAQLKVDLKAKAHPVALITAREAASHLPAVISSTMRQYMPGVPEAKAADDIPALLAWWQDEWQRAYGPCAHAGLTSATPAAATAQTPRTAGKARDKTAADAMDMDHAVTPMTALSSIAGAAATPGRELRTRQAAKTPGKRGVSTGPMLAVPVVVLQDADSGDLETLEELVVAFSEARIAGLPVVLVLGVSSSPACLLQLLPNALLRRVSMLSLALPPARQQLVHVYRALLLRAPQPHLLLGPQLAAWLLQHFRDADCSASMAERVMQLVCVEHFRSQPLSCLAAAAATGRRSKLAEAVAALPLSQIIHCCRAVLSHPAANAVGSSSSSSAASPSRNQAAKLISTEATAASGSAECTAAAAFEQLRVFADAQCSGSSKPPSKQKLPAAAAGASSATAADVLENMVWAAMQAFGRWRLGVLMLNTLAQFTGVADVDASFQLPSLFAAASQDNFLTSKTRGSLSPCGMLLLKLLGNGSSSSPRRAGVTTVQELQDEECMQLLRIIQQLVGSGAGLQQQQLSVQDGPDAAALRSESEFECGSDSDSDDEATPDPATDSALLSCWEVQQLQQALQALQQLTTQAGQDAAVAEESPKKKQKRHRMTQQQQSQEVLFANFHEDFLQLLTPLPEKLEQPPAAPRHALLPSAAAAGGTPGSVCTPLGKAGQKGNGSTGSDIPTPGGLASALRKHVRFAPDTPGAPVAANGKQLVSLSAHSTPDDGAAVAGHIKTPNKRGTKKEQPRKALFTQAAAAAAAAAAAEGGKGRRTRKSEKQPEEQGEIAGTSAAALAAVAAAAVAAAAAGGAAGSPQVPAAAGNKRAQRLMQLLAATNGGSSAGDSRSSTGNSTPAAGSTGRRSSSSSKGLLSTPTHAEVSDGAAGASSPEGALLSPRSSRASTRQRSITAAAAGAVTPPAAGAGGRGACRSSSRLSRQSEPQHNVGTTVEDEEVVADADETTAVQQLADVGNVTAVGAACAAPAQGCSSTLASLLSATIPKLLHDWCSTGSSNSSGGVAHLAAAGAAAFVFDDVELVSSMLCAAPRCAVHSALTEPAKLIKGHPVLQGPGWEDTCLAYLLLQQQREDSLAVSDWFGMFCQAQGVKGLVQGSVDGEEEGLDAVPGTGRAAKARARAGRKARGYAEARETSAGNGASAAATPTGKANSSKKAGASGSSKDQIVTPKAGAKKRPAAAAAGAAAHGASDQHQQEGESKVDEQELLSAAARFCQSVAELQHLGVWKATKRRRLAAVQRVFAPEGPGMVLRYSSSAAATAAMDSLPDHDYDY